MQAASIRTSLVIIQPTPFCNIDCRYCYLPLRFDRTRLGLDQIKQIFGKLLTFPTIKDDVTIVWHAGEPLVLGVPYYENFFSEIERLTKGRLTIRHSMQTNATLVTDAWCAFFKRWNVGLGVSVDGPKFIHDIHRKTRSGKGTYDQAVAGMQRLSANDIPFYVISVLTRDAISNPDAMFDFYQRFDIRDVGFNIEEKEGVNGSPSLDRDLDDTLISDFFARFVELMIERNFPIAVRELEEMLGAIRMLDRSGPLSHQNIPFGIITIDVKGNVYTFSPELVGFSSESYATFAIGNIFEATYEQLSESKTLKAMTADIGEGIELCRRDCGYFGICGGGTPSNKLFENGSFASTETVYCRLTKKRVADFVLSTIESRRGLIHDGKIDLSDF